MDRLGYLSLEEVERNWGAAEECCEGVASKVLQVTAVGLQKLIYERKGILNDFIPLRGEHIPP